MTTKGIYSAVFAILILGVVAYSSSLIQSKADPLPSYGSPIITTVAHTGDIEVTGTLANLTTSPQVVLTTPEASYDGNSVVVDFSLEYVNEIPDPTQASNGIGFDLYEDGTDTAHHLERLALFGGHANGTAPLFGPVFTHTILDGAATPTAGMHVFYLVVWRWQPAGDGYLRAGDSSYGGVAQPMRLTISHT